jgi:hypothetical protein
MTDRRRFRPPVLALEVRAVPAGPPGGADPPPPDPGDTGGYDPSQDPDWVEATDDIDRGDMALMLTAEARVAAVVEPTRQGVIDQITGAKNDFNVLFVGVVGAIRDAQTRMLQETLRINARVQGMVVQTQADLDRLNALADRAVRMSDGVVRLQARLGEVIDAGNRINARFDELIGLIRRMDVFVTRDDGTTTDLVEYASDGFEAVV